MYLYLFYSLAHKSLWSSLSGWFYPIYAQLMLAVANCLLDLIFITYFNCTATTTICPEQNNQLKTTIVQTPMPCMLCNATWWMKIKLPPSGERQWSYQEGTMCTVKMCTLSRIQTKMFTLLQVNVTKNTIPSLNYSVVIYTNIIV